MHGSHLCIPGNENVWPPYYQNRIIMFFLPISTFRYLWAIYIFPRSICLFCCNQIGRPILFFIGQGSRSLLPIEWRYSQILKHIWTLTNFTLLGFSETPAASQSIFIIEKKCPPKVVFTCRNLLRPLLGLDLSIFVKIWLNLSRYPVPLTVPLTQVFSCLPLLCSSTIFWTQ
jgi:hypothetical protein